MRLDAEYVLPLRWSDDTDLDDLTDYLADLVQWIDVTVVDDSPPELFAAHARAFPLRGGASYAGRRLRRAATPARVLRGRVAGGRVRA